MGIRRFIIKSKTFPKLTYRLHKIMIKFQLLFSKSDKVILKFMWIYKSPRIFKIILKRKNKVGGLIVPDFMLTIKL